MQQLSGKLGDIVKPMVLNKFQKAREEEHHHGQLEATTNSTPRNQLCQPLVTTLVIGIEAFGPPPIQFGTRKWLGIYLMS